MYILLSFKEPAGPWSWCWCGFCLQNPVGFIDELFLSTGRASTTRYKDQQRVVEQTHGGLVRKEDLDTGWIARCSPDRQVNKRAGGCRIPGQIT